MAKNKNNQAQNSNSADNCHDSSDMQTRNCGKQTTNKSSNHAGKNRTETEDSY